MEVIFSNSIRKRALAKLGSPSMEVELEKEAMQGLFINSQKDWNLYATLSNLDEKKLYGIKKEWIENYFQALCKEALGRIRGKYSGEINIPGVVMKLEYEALLKESIQEKENLIGLLIPTAEKILLAVYVNVGNLEAQEVDYHMKKLQSSVGEDRGYKYFFIAVRDQESRIECVYPNIVNNEEITAKLNILLDDIIKNTSDEK